MKNALILAGRFLARWHRFAIPVGLVLAVTVFTLVTHAIQGDHLTDRDFLNPASHAANGGAVLAGQLAARGIDVEVDNGANPGLISAENGNTTLFIPAPSLLNPHQLEFLNVLPADDTIVLVAPDQATLALAALPVDKVASHWSTLVAEPDCDEAIATPAGVAGIDGREYHGHLNACYHGALARLYGIMPQIWLAGASDVFRNDRIGENDNNNLAVGLLDSHPRLVWINIHDAEPPPRVENVPPGDSQSPDVVNENGSGDYPGTGHRGSGGNGGGSDASGQASIAALFPPWVWSTVALLVLVALALALAAARRMGPPVTEPMPVTARLRESVEGRGRLYRRAKQPAAALDVLRRAAINSMPGLLGLPASTPVTTLLDHVAEATGLTRDTVDGILRDNHPKDNAELVAAVRRLDELMTLLSDAAGAPGTPINGTDLK